MQTGTKYPNQGNIHPTVMMAMKAVVEIQQSLFLAETKPAASLFFIALSIGIDTTPFQKFDQVWTVGNPAKMIVAANPTQ